MTAHTSAAPSRGKPPACGLPSRWSLASCIGLLAIAAFAAAIGNDFIYDDRALLVERLEGIGWGDVPALLGQDYWGQVARGSLYRPVTLVALAIQKLSFGPGAAGYHLVSLVLHAACCVLVLQVASRLCGTKVGFVAAALFAVHPVHAEAVITVYGQADLLASMFTLAALSCCVAIEPSGGESTGAKRTSRTRRALLWVGMIASAALAVGSKEAALVLPALAMLLRGLRPGRVRTLNAVEPSPAPRGDRPWWQPRRWIGTPQLVLALVVIGYFLARYAAIGELAVAGDATISQGYPLKWRAKVVLIALAHDIRLSLLPWGQTAYYGHLRDSILGQPTRELVWVAAAALATALLLRLSPSRGVRLALGWFAIAVLPVVNIVPIGAIVAERFLYLPSVGVAMLIALGLAHWQTIAGHRERATSMKSARAAPAIAFALLLVAETAQSVAVCSQWRSEESLWRHTVAHYPASPKAHFLLGMALLQRAAAAPAAPAAEQAIAQAVDHFEKSLTLNPTSADPYRGLGLAAMQRGHYDQAVAHLREALSRRPDDPLIQRTLEQALELQRGKE